LLDYLTATEQTRLAALRAGTSPPREARAEKREPTLAEMGFPFPLFESTLVSADLDEAGACRACATHVELRFARACYACFRAGKVDCSTDTELGLVTAADAAAGLTQGFPGCSKADARGTERVPKRRGEPYARFRADPALLTELLRTPSYSTWQGANWLFCCGGPMVFIGNVDRPELEAWSAEAACSMEQLVSGLLAPEPIEDPERFVDKILSGGRSVYAFRCPRCHRRRAHWDMD
jgi:hypothetical protein